MFLKEILNLCFLLPIFGNDYFVVRYIKIRTDDIIKYIESQTLTSCHMKCAANPSCVVIGLLTNPDLFDMHRCYLLKKKQERNEAEGDKEKVVETKSLFVVMEVIPLIFYTFILSHYLRTLGHLKVR